MGRKLNCGTNKYIPKVSQINRHSHKNDGWFHLKQNQTQAGRADRGHGRMDGEDMDTTHYTLCWFLLWLFKASLNSKHVLFFFFCILYQKLEKVRVWAKPGPRPVFRNRLVWHTVTATCWYPVHGYVHWKAEPQSWEPWPMNTIHYLVFFFLKVCNSWFQPRTTFKFESPEIQNMICGFREKWALLFWLERW